MTDSTAAAEKWQLVLDAVVTWLTNTGIKIVIALVLMLVSFKLINYISKKVYLRMQTKAVDETISRVVRSVLRVGGKLLVSVCLVGYVGIETASVSACIATLGVGVSLAVQGTLSNFAGGIILVIMRPFKIGDYITSGDSSGTVDDIKLFYTSVVTPDNRVIYIPNGTLANNVIVNASVKETRRVDLVIPIAYEADAEKAREIILAVCGGCDAIHKTPPTFCEVTSLAASAVNLTVRAWVDRKNYWDVYYYLLSEIRAQFNFACVEIPYNKMQVQIKKEN